MMIETWQLTHWNYLTKLKKLPHAILLWGEKGLGISTLAEHFSAWLLCEKKDAFPCQKCTSCQWFYAKTHPDFLIIQPENNRINVDTIRDIRPFSDTKSHGGAYKIIMISPVEAMNVAASNALLKVLEEPFEKTIFILISHQLTQVLPTILSRCQKIHFPTLSREEFSSFMLKNGAMSQAEIERLYRLSHGAPFCFSSHAEQEIAIKTQKKIEALMEKVFLLSSPNLSNSAFLLVNPIEAAEQIKAIEKESQMSFDSLVDMMMEWIYTQIVKDHSSQWYVIYDKLIEIKKHMLTGVPINHNIWLEDVFYAR